MRPILAIIALLFTALTVASCGAESPGASSEAASSGDREEPVFMVFVEHADDVAAWNARYESSAEARANHGMLEVLSAEDLDSTGTVVVIQEVQDPDRVEDYLASEVAVLGASPESYPASPAILESGYRMIELGAMPDRPVALIVIRNRVDDFDAWRAEFDRAAAIRTEAGIHVAGIGRGLEDDANLLQAYFATDLDEARRWAEGEAAVSIRFLDPIN